MPRDETRSDGREIDFECSGLSQKSRPAQSSSLLVPARSSSVRKTLECFVTNFWKEKKEKRYDGLAVQNKYYWGKETSVMIIVVHPAHELMNPKYYKGLWAVKFIKKFAGPKNSFSQSQNEKGGGPVVIVIYFLSPGLNKIEGK